jgi:hypothetical protein
MFYDIKVRNPIVCVTSWVCLFMVILQVTLMLQAGLSCMDSKGCLRPWCKQTKLNNEYKLLASERWDLGNCRNFSNYNSRE